MGQIIKYNGRLLRYVLCFDSLFSRSKLMHSRIETHEFNDDKKIDLDSKSLEATHNIYKMLSKNLASKL